VAEILTHEAEKGAMTDAGDDRPNASVPLIASDDRDHGAEKPDDAAGCEFVDDRIRELE
jgi:hypothetical protein